MSTYCIDICHEDESLLQRCIEALREYGRQIGLRGKIEEGSWWQEYPDKVVGAIRIYTLRGYEILCQIFDILDIPQGKCRVWETRQAANSGSFFTAQPA